MTLKNTADRWGPVSQAFHWIIVLLILGLAIVGLTMGELPKTPKYFWVYTAHKSTGLLVLALVIARLGWRLYAGKPEPVPGTPTWQERIATVTHWLLYGLILLMPISGWLYDSASGLRPFRWYGLFDVPKLSPPDESLRNLSHEVHEWGFWVLLALVIAHAGAAFYHHYFQRDATLTRMLPRRSSPIVDNDPAFLLATKPEEPPHVP
jgi:cytochrome b561